MDNDQDGPLFRWVLRPIGLLLMKLGLVKADRD